MRESYFFYYLFFTVVPNNLLIQLKNICAIPKHSGIVLLFLIVILSGCGASNEKSPENAQENAAFLKEIETIIGIRFPEGVTLVRYAYDTRSDALIRARLSFTPTQWKRFISTSPFENAVFEEEQRYRLGPNVYGWWNPEAPGTLPTAQIRLPNAEALNMGVDKSNPEVFIVFLIWHRT